MTADQLRRWETWHNEQLAQALNGPHGDTLFELLEFLGDLTPTGMPKLLEIVRQPKWTLADIETRMVALHEINRTISRVREAAGAVPFNDALPGEPDTGFLVVRALLR
jgi:hypothetical protein